MNPLSILIANFKSWISYFIKKKKKIQKKSYFKIPCLNVPKYHYCSWARIFRRLFSKGCTFGSKSGTKDLVRRYQAHHSLIHSFTIHSFTHSLIHSFTHSFIHYSLIHSFPQSLSHSASSLLHIIPFYPNQQFKFNLSCSPTQDTPLPTWQKKACSAWQGEG